MTKLRDIIAKLQAVETEFGDFDFDIIIHFPDGSHGEPGSGTIAVVCSDADGEKYCLLEVDAEYNAG